MTREGVLPGPQRGGPRGRSILDSIGDPSVGEAVLRQWEDPSRARGQLTLDPKGPPRPKEKAPEVGVPS